VCVIVFWERNVESETRQSKALHGMAGLALAPGINESLYVVVSTTSTPR
jgi:hypothetical protein